MIIASWLMDMYMYVFLVDVMAHARMPTAGAVVDDVKNADGSAPGGGDCLQRADRPAETTHAHKHRQLRLHPDRHDVKYKSITQIFQINLHVSGVVLTKNMSNKS